MQLESILQIKWAEPEQPTETNIYLYIKAFCLHKSVGFQISK